MLFLNFFKSINLYTDYTKYNKYIYLGNIYAAQNNDFLKKNDISVIVNCSKDIEFSKLSSIQYKYRININDNTSIQSIQYMSLYMKYLIPIINDHINKKKKVLIHCRAGMQRSAAFLAALFMYRYNINKVMSMYFINKKRIFAFFPLSNFSLSLDIYENYLNYCCPAACGV